ncbi:HD domain-containing protein [Nocardia testacea]|uniref:HD domain-containing protein n=1 Tax=Nocardia testacea TaxID=248551 RepID=UPI003C2CA929
MLTALPDSPTARAAAALAAEAAPTDLLNHSYRTYLFGRCLVTSNDIDHEAAFVAAMIHDLGLTERHRGPAQFADVGAELACRFLEGRGWDMNRIHLVEQAILRHTNLPAEHEPVHRLIQAGAAVDVAGLGHGEIEAEDLSEILTAFPRLDFAARMRHRFLHEVDSHPGGAFADLERTVALSERFATNPIDRLTGAA